MDEDLILMLVLLSIIAVVIILTVLGAKRKKQTFSVIAIFLSAIPLFYSSLLLIGSIMFGGLITILSNVVLELVGLAGVIINIRLLLKNRTVRTKDLNVVSCPHCGTLLPTGKKFCTKCGAELNPTNENETI